METFFQSIIHQKDKPTALAELTADKFTEQQRMTVPTSTQLSQISVSRSHSGLERFRLLATVNAQAKFTSRLTAPTASNKMETGLETLITKVQKFTVWLLAAMQMVVVLLSALHLGVLIAQEIWTPPRFLIRVQGLLEVFGYFLLVLIGVELLETLKAYVKRDVIHVRVVLEVALIAMARKVIIEEPNAVPRLTLFGIAALILALGVAFCFEPRQAKKGITPWRASQHPRGEWLSYQSPA